MQRTCPGKQSALIPKLNGVRPQCMCLRSSMGRSTHAMFAGLINTHAVTRTLAQSTFRSRGMRARRPKGGRASERERGEEERGVGSGTKKATRDESGSGARGAFNGSSLEAQRRWLEVRRTELKSKEECFACVRDQTVTVFSCTLAHMRSTCAALKRACGPRNSLLAHAPSLSVEKCSTHASGVRARACVCVSTLDTPGVKASTCARPRRPWCITLEMTHIIDQCLETRQPRRKNVNVIVFALWLESFV